MGSAKVRTVDLAGDAFEEDRRVGADRGRHGDLSLLHGRGRCCVAVLECGSRLLRVIQPRRISSDGRLAVVVVGVDDEPEIETLRDPFRTRQVGCAPRSRAGLALVACWSLAVLDDQRCPLLWAQVCQVELKAEGAMGLPTPVPRTCSSCCS